MKIKGGARRIAHMVDAGWKLHVHPNPRIKLAWLTRGLEFKAVRYRHARRAAAYAMIRQRYVSK